MNPVRLLRGGGGPPEPGTRPLLPPAADARLRLAVAGDVGQPSEALGATVAAMVAAQDGRPFDGLVLLGDNVYPDGDPGDVEAAVLGPFAPLLGDGTRLLAVLGNHDVQSGRGDEIARRMAMAGRWYAADLGEVLFVGLDSTQPRNPEQRAWLVDTLDAAAAPFVVVALHHPPWSAGWHGPDRSVRRAFGSLFRRFPVDLVLAGHEHDYQRSRPLGGTTYVISGAATHLRRTGRGRHTEVSASVHHFVDLRVVEDRLELRAVDHGGRVIDHVDLPAGRKRARA